MRQLSDSALRGNPAPRSLRRSAALAFSADRRLTGFFADFEAYPGYMGFGMSLQWEAVRARYKSVTVMVEWRVKVKELECVSKAYDGK